MEILPLYGGKPDDLPSDKYGLTPQQTEVLRLMCSGLTDKGIANHLEISPKTVENHMAVIIAKFGLFRSVRAVI